MHLVLSSVPLMPLNLLGEIGKGQAACAAQEKDRATADDVGDDHDCASATEQGGVAAVEGGDGLVP